MNRLTMKIVVFGFRAFVRKPTRNAPKSESAVSFFATGPSAEQYLCAQLNQIGRADQLQDVEQGRRLADQHP